MNSVSDVFKGLFDRVQQLKSLRDLPHQEQQIPPVVVALYRKHGKSVLFTERASPVQSFQRVVEPVEQHQNHRAID